MGSKKRVGLDDEMIEKKMFKRNGEIQSRYTSSPAAVSKVF